ncbi:YIP1 family protein [Pseudooceanicola sp. CBS1P-1]|uniref:YIP1 family protein n=1 Tax=Pseudooceanicola albus TaxID=2692189 RepID=A0A6L7FYK4_9RHOB|nr:MULTISPECIES: YIP1 family protein [Pseudooceanicola]MBT9383297.1 YIP1 family protein [Pseudooceanicola endophyticus]MXN16380.1 YIP1 family protein [Pseudooceanicola albus]
MSLIGNIAATYRGPRRVLRQLLAQGPREDRALALLMGSVVMIFVVQWPRLSREALESGENLQMLLGGALFGLVFILPLLLYILAMLSHWGMRLFGGQGSGYGARLALFWALAAAMPLLVLHGLVAGLIGPGPEKALVGLGWLAVFLWFWLAGLWEAGRGPKTERNG